MQPAAPLPLRRAQSQSLDQKETAFVSPAHSRSNSLFGIYSDEQLSRLNEDQADFGHKREV